MTITFSTSLVLSKSIVWAYSRDFVSNGYIEWPYKKDLYRIKRNPAAKKNNTTA